MNKLHLLYGLLLGVATTALGVFVFVSFTPYRFSEYIEVLRLQGNLGKLITLGAVLNLALFFGLLKAKKDLMARGVILATILLTIVTLFV